MYPMLCKELDRDFTDSLVDDDRYAFEPKVDGDRKLVQISDKVRVFGRDGQRTDLPKALVSRLSSALGSNIVIDCELVGQTLHVFDLVSAGVVVGPGDPWARRRNRLEMLLEVWGPPEGVVLMPVAITTEEKRDMVERLHSQRAEGFVAKRMDAVYRLGQGKSIRSDSWVKRVFRKTIDCKVVGFDRDGKANIVLGLWNGEKYVEVGEVAAHTGDGPRVKGAVVVDWFLNGPGVVVTVIYRHMTAGGKLLMPVKSRLRYDKSPLECTFDQVVHAPDVAVPC